jgi:hypothetical protein
MKFILCSTYNSHIEVTICEHVMRQKTAPDQGAAPRRCDAAGTRQPHRAPGNSVRATRRPKSLMRVANDIRSRLAMRML